MITRSMFSHVNNEYPVSKDDWSTPPALMVWLKNNYGDLFDPCPLYSQIDGLKAEWQSRNYVNPPYSEISKWARKSYEEYLKGRFVAFLCFARTDTQYFHKYLVNCSIIYLIEGRLKFGDGKGSATFPSILCIFDPAINRSGEAPELRILKKCELQKITGLDSYC